MARLLTALVAGLIFGFGLGLSHMVNPEKVLGFLDVTGSWDPSLGLVMAGAVAVTLASFRRILSWPEPKFGGLFRMARFNRIDPNLLAGAATFGVGWGMVGFCPGPAVSSFAYLMPESAIFLAAMLIGAALARLVPRAPARSGTVSAEA